MTVLPNGTLLVAKPDNAYLCVLTIRDQYIQYKIAGQNDLGDAPRSWCVSVDQFKRVGEK